MAYEYNSLRNNCVQDGNRCLFSAHVAQYFEDQTGTVTYPGTITTEAQLLDKINSGKNTVLNTDITVANIFGGLTPSTLTYDSGT